MPLPNNLTKAKTGEPWYKTRKLSDPYDLHLVVESATAEKLRVASFELNRNRCDILREALDEWLAKHESVR
jgi:hypothetical protein